MVIAYIFSTKNVCLNLQMECHDFLQSQYYSAADSYATPTDGAGRILISSLHRKKKKQSNAGRVALHALLSKESAPSIVHTFIYIPVVYIYTMHNLHQYPLPLPLHCTSLSASTVHPYLPPLYIPICLHCTSLSASVSN